MKAHAALSPSSAERWLNCPASVRMAEKVPPIPPSPYAEEGTLAHALAEIEAGAHFGLITPRQRTIRRNKWLKRAEEFGMDLSEAERHVAGYVAYLAEQAARHPNTQVLLEQRMPSGIDGVWGTSDAVLVSPDTVTIVDLKYGRGLVVHAGNNPQLRLYALGALDTFGDVLGTTKQVTMAVYQPRLAHVSSTTITADELRAWRDWAKPKAMEALSENAPFRPSESACRWCPAAGVCRARAERMAGMDFGVDPDVLTPAELGEVLTMAAELKAWIKSVEDHALHAAYSEQQHIPGWKVVRSGGRRVVKDVDAAVEAFKAVGISEEHVTERKLVTLKKLDDLARTVHTGLEDVLGDLLEHTEGKIALVPEEDRRTAIDPSSEAIQEFSNTVPDAPRAG